jgi:ATP-dependent helicase/nuclease subunit A
MTLLTPSQQQALEREGDLLVVAGAGTGKTRTLVERCLARLTQRDHPTPLDRMLVVTFTEAAASEVRRRIRERLQEHLAADPDNGWLDEQLARVDAAPIATLHGFCLRLVREHFHELGLDPQLTVLPEEQARALRSETLNALLERILNGNALEAENTRQFLLEHDRGLESPVRHLVQRIHDYTQTLAKPQGWFDKEQEYLRQSYPAHWVPWLISGTLAWRALWLPTLRAQSGASDFARQAATLLERIPPDASRSQIAETLRAVRDADTPEAWPRGSRTRLRKSLGPFMADAAFLHSVAHGEASSDPLAQDWAWIRSPALALLSIASDFSSDYARAKRDLGAIDFHDLEQFALRLLRNPDSGEPSDIALAWRARLDFLFVDEYQDINEAQDAILRALAREGGAANRFLVGDVKQSIYRFRLADPRIFQTYTQAWRALGSSGGVIDLTTNFRSRPRLLQFVNSCFEPLMRPELGGIDYAQGHALQPGHPGDDDETDEPVEGHLVVSTKSETSEEEEAASPDSARTSTDTEREALLIGRRLKELHATALARGQRLAWRDMAVLLRAPRPQAQTYVKVFGSLGIPLAVPRTGFFDCLEVSDLVNLLRVLDNPLQDLPLLAALRSPLVGLEDNQLAAVRTTAPRGRFWTALVRAARVAAPHPAAARALEGARPRIRSFLETFRRWRQLAREDSLSQCLETLLHDTRYEFWLATQSRGSERQANVHRLLTLSRQFDRFHRQGLFRFLKFVELQDEADTEPPEATTAPVDAVQLVSIHQSKGLEFQVVAVGGLGRRFNTGELRERVILDERYGLCPRVQPPGSTRHYPSLPYWLAAFHRRADSLGEELRLLYVAFTRARQRLLLCGSASQKEQDAWANGEAAVTGALRLLTAKCALDWLGPLLVRTTQPPLVRLYVHESHAVAPPPANASSNSCPTQPTHPLPTPDQLAAMEWTYRFATATAQPAKTSVSEVRRRATETDETAGGGLPGQRPRARRRSDDRADAAQTGIAHHAFLEAVRLEQTATAAQLRQEAQRLEEEGLLLPAQARALDFAALARFWQSPLGNSLRLSGQHVHRELPFTARVNPSDFSRLGLQPPPGLPESDFVVVQGVVDLAVILPAEIWILDFKTDRVGADGAGPFHRRYAPQVQLYALALSRIYHRPVTRIWLHLLRWDDPCATLEIGPPAGDLTPA